MVLLNLIKMLVDHTNQCSKGSTPNILFVKEDGAPVAPDSASIADFYNPDEPDPELLCQSKQILGIPIWLSMQN